MEKLKGKIHGNESGLFPCLWVGLANHAIPEQMNESDLKPGQFLFEHQYMGLACHQVKLWGAVFPISTCNSPRIMSQFYKLEKKYYDAPFMGWDPSIDDLVRVKKDLLSIGPLDCNSEFGLIGEAFLTFSFTEDAFGWIKKHFKMVTKIKDSSDYAPVEVLKEEKIKVKTDKEFSDWFKIGEKGIFPFFPFWLKGAFLYENSD